MQKNWINCFPDRGSQKKLWKILKLTIVLLFGFVMTLSANITNVDNSQQSQKKEVKGLVFDSKGLPIPGVTILAKGTNSGINTEMQGRYKF